MPRRHEPMLSPCSPARALRVWCMLTALALLAGCAPATILPNPEGWPEELSGRKLYHTPNAYIYATSDAAAGELDRRYVEVRKRFVEQTAGRPGDKPLLIATDADDAPLFDTAEEYYAVATRHGIAEEKDYTGVTFRMGGNRQDYERYCAKAGVRPIDGPMMVAVPLDGDDLVNVLKLPQSVADAVPWAIALPTDAAVERLYGKMAGVMYEEQSLGMKLLLLPFLPVINGVSQNVTQAMCRAQVFRSLLQRHQEWSPEVLAEHFDIYRQIQIRAALGPLAPVLLKD